VNNYPAKVRQTAYRILDAAVIDIFQQSVHRGTHYKFVLWPLVICGIETVARGHGVKLQFLCEALEKTTIDLGTLAM
jgi:hypothetical protein